jgi:ribosomal protein S27E
MSVVARAPPYRDPPGYGRHRPEATLLYQRVQQHYPAFRELRGEAGRPLPAFVQEEFEAYLKCGRLEEGFLRVPCDQCHAEKLVAFSCKKRGFCPSCGARRMAETAALPVRAGSPCMRAWTSRRTSARSSSACAATWAVRRWPSSRLALTVSGQVRYTLKTPYRDGTTHVVLKPLDLMARLAALVPPPRMHLTRYHGVFAPRSGALAQQRSRPLIRPSRRRHGISR